MSRDKKPTNWVAFRIITVAIVFAVGASLLILRAYKLTVTESETLQKKAEKQRTRVITLESRRGMILDRSGEQLAASLEVNSIYARPRRISNQERHDASRKLAELLDMDPKEVKSKLGEDRPFVWIKRRVSPYVAEKVKKADIDGIYIGSEYSRFYPLKKFAAHAIGFAGMDSKGLEGIELYYDDYLKTEPIPVTGQKDALGRPVMFNLMGVAPVRNDIYLTLDRNIQHIVEKELDEAIRQEQAKSAQAIVMDIDTGEILALAIRPTFNLNTSHEAAPGNRRNRAVADTFEPGSTFKVFLAAALLELNKVTDGETIFCHNGLMKYNGAEIHDVAPHKTLSFEDVIAQSSNIGAVKLSDKLTKKDFYRLLTDFGFGSVTNVDFPGERNGMLPPPEKWSALTKATVAFGQGVSVSPIQLISAFSAVVNGGNYYWPHITAKITNHVGETALDLQPRIQRRVIRQQTSDQVIKILRKAATVGTAKAAFVKGADVIGKTGTAQKADPGGGYSKDRYVMSFIGAMMGVKPRMAILVMIDEPRVYKDRTGGKVAAPVFKRMAEGILALCGSQPSVNTNSIMASRGEWSHPASAPEKSVSLIPGPNPGEWFAPDLKGLDMRQVLDALNAMKSDVSMEGLGKVVSQKPKPGTLIKEGASVHVVFAGGNP